MTHDESRSVDRRSVLRALGTTAVAAIGASGVSAASHVQPGDHVHITNDYDVRGVVSACDYEPLGPVYSAGSYGLVEEVRDCYYRGPMVKFFPMEIGEPDESSWIEDEFVVLVSP